MSKLSESRGVFYMSDGISKKSELILPENQLLKDIEREKEEKKAGIDMPKEDFFSYKRILEGKNTFFSRKYQFLNP